VTPEPGSVYRDESGRLLLYVRTELRAGAKIPEHLFVHTRDRVILTSWLPELPPAAELVIDTEGRRQANEESWLRLVAEQEIGVLAGLLRKACSWLPQQRAGELRAEYGAWKEGLQ
jgi:hypothetical protein